MSQLIQYLIALSNPYGIVHKDKIVEIYNSQNYRYEYETENWQK